MRKQLITAVVVAIGAMASGAASAVPIWSGSLSGWASAVTITDPSGQHSFTYGSYTGVDPLTTMVTIDEIAVGSVEKYDVQFNWLGSGNTGGGLSVPGTISYGVSANVYPLQGLTNVGFDTLATGPLATATKAVNPGGILLIGGGGYTEAALPFLHTASVTDTFTPGPGATFQVAHNVFTVTAVPEPEAYLMMLAGLGVMGVLHRRRKNRG